MSISVNFQGKIQTLKPPKKFNELKKHLKTKLTGLDKQAWEFYYYDQDNDDIQVVEEEEYQSLIDFAKEQKKAVKCQIRYKTSSKLEESKQDISDADSKSGEPAKLSSKSSRKNSISDQSYVDTEKIQESEPQEEQKETIKSATQPTSNVAKQTVKAPQEPPVKTQKMKQGSSSENQSSSEVQDDEEQEEEKRDTIKPTQSKIVPEQPIKPQQTKIKESKQSEPPVKVSSSTAAQKKRVEQPPIQSSQPPKVKQSVKIQDSEPQKFEEKKMEKSRVTKIKKHEKVQQIAERETVTVTIPKEQYERLLRVQKAYQNRQFETVDREFASGIKNTTFLEKCTFCASEDNLNVIPTFESLLICDNCNQKFEIKLKVNPYRSKVSRNSSALSGNKLF